MKSLLLLLSHDLSLFYEVILITISDIGIFIRYLHNILDNDSYFILYYDKFLHCEEIQ